MTRPQPTGFTAGGLPRGHTTVTAGTARKGATVPITNHEVAVKLGATPDASGGYLGSEYISRGIPLFAGCEGCGATLAPYNAYPSLSGYLRCSDCIGHGGFDTWDDYVAHYGALGIDVTAQPQEERAWWTRPCEYGHQECSFRRDGPCGDEHNHPDPDLEEGA